MQPTTEEEQIAMFDWWERTYNYRSLTLKNEKLKPFYGLLLRLFFETSTQVATETTSSVRHLEASLVMTYFANKLVKSTDIEQKVSNWYISLFQGHKLGEKSPRHQSNSPSTPGGSDVQLSKHYILPWRSETYGEFSTPRRLNHSAPVFLVLLQSGQQGVPVIIREYNLTWSYRLQDVDVFALPKRGK